MEHIDVTIVLVAVATTCTIIMIGLGFLPHPGRAASIWSSGFALAMLSCYLLVAADQIGSHHLRGAAHGPILCAVAFVWIGLRARRGREPIMLVPTIVVFSAATVVLGLTAETLAYGTVFRVSFLLAAATAGLAAWELLRLRKAEREMSLPLIVVACGFVGLAVLVAIDGLIRLAEGTIGETEADLQDLYDLNEVVALLYLICALVTLLYLARRGAQTNEQQQTVEFFGVARDRLARAQVAGDRWWSLIDVRLDDAGELLDASSGRAFQRITARFADDIRAVMPPEADIHAVSPTQVLVLLPRPDTAVRGLLSRLLDRIGTLTDQPAVPIRLSASIGVAAAPLADYDLDRLTAAAGEAAEHAQISGGDRWERAVFAP
ncbi:GGDEF domain-containing protein, diguanylate cyclase (c-di-GMP synthetase) or its enzymatically inactive variants [Microbacterium sp. LKL04]|uniref:hypothetical protein n=1 Tax=Microbacterium sp. LKL04 TaxID=912630 RepID=UPI000875D0B9|nr:hypothetical protein [Microbacterium sp. LKL04]SCY47475.1 GGDEF domain-containing protein, diguanylate cyclase (c-di-GMP synthetase) or its enzymatically inactive variants [Microbacterium sp. LKL04]